MSRSGGLCGFAVRFLTTISVRLFPVFPGIMVCPWTHQHARPTIQRCDRGVGPLACLAVRGAQLTLQTPPTPLQGWICPCCKGVPR